jgi:hypothetical protein
MKYLQHTQTVWVISGFSRETDENCALLGHYAASSGNLLPTFRDNLTFPSSEVNSPEENYALLGHYAASSGNFLPTFRDKISVPFSKQS